jgi:extracellular factor (EF) 3-hydroxypalmitic acid methyl ester biosynthesis protein
MISETSVPTARQLLDSINDQLTRNTEQPGVVIERLAVGLNNIRLDALPEVWKSVVAECRSHPLRWAIHEDPLTHRAFSQPRGYQGDAELLDMIYRKDWAGICKEPVSELGRGIFRHTIECVAPSAVRERRRILAEMIDAVCEETSQPHILSVACGHLREARTSRTVKAGKVGRFIGLDQDPCSVSLVNAELVEYGVRAVKGSLKNLLSGSLASERFDYIYSAGLYDYLEDRLANKITERMFEMLKPGGRLLVANYLPGIQDVGYMEAYMNWNLIYRDGAAMQALSSGIDESQMSERRVFTDSNQTVIYLVLRKG